MGAATGDTTSGTGSMGKDVFAGLLASSTVASGFKACGT